MLSSCNGGKYTGSSPGINACGDESSGSNLGRNETIVGETRNLTEKYFIK